MRKRKCSVKAPNQLLSIDILLNEAKHNLNCNEQEYLLSRQWLVELNTLSIKYSYLNVRSDLSNMPLSELWGVYLWLKRFEVKHG